AVVGGRRGAVCRGRDLPAHAGQAAVSRVVPVADYVHPRPHAARRDWRLPARRRARALLRRLLLGADAAAVCRRNHETLDDCRAYACCAPRETRAVRSSHAAAERRRTDGRGGVDGGSLKRSTIMKRLLWTVVLAA